MNNYKLKCCCGNHINFKPIIRTLEFVGTCVCGIQYGFTFSNSNLVFIKNIDGSIILEHFSAFIDESPPHIAIYITANNSVIYNEVCAISDDIDEYLISLFKKTLDNMMFI